MMSSTEFESFLRTSSNQNAPLLVIWLLGAGLPHWGFHQRVPGVFSPPLTGHQINYPIYQREPRAPRLSVRLFFLIHFPTKYCQNIRRSGFLIKYVSLKLTHELYDCNEYYKRNVFCKGFHLLNENKWLLDNPLLWGTNPRKKNLSFRHCPNCSN